VGNEWFDQMSGDEGNVGVACVCLGLSG